MDKETRSEEIVIYSSDEDATETTKQSNNSNDCRFEKMDVSISSNSKENEDRENNPRNDSGGINLSRVDSRWTEVDAVPALHDFIGQEGLKGNILPETTPFDIFLLLFDSGLLKKIVNWTNAHGAVSSGTTAASDGSNSKNWKNVTIDEMKKFLGLCIMMGNIHMPTSKAYWSDDDLLYYHPLFGQTMSRNRFRAILSCLRFRDGTSDKTDGLHNIDQVLDRVVANIQKVYYPGENLSLGEVLLLWRGRLSYERFVPHEKVKSRKKIYELCTSDGFVLNFFIHYGKGTVDNENGHAYGIAYKLLKNYLRKGHTVYLDSYYSNLRLIASLYEDRTHVVGMLRKNRRGNPNYVVGKKLKEGESVFARNNNILVQKWRGKREVLIISTKHDASFKEVVPKKGSAVRKPSAVIDYESNMSGTEGAFEMIDYFSSPRESLLWYQKFFFHIMDITIWDACWLYNKTHSSKLNYVGFRNAIAKQLLNVDSIKKDPPSINPPQVQHFPKKLGKRLRCRVCSTKKLRKDTFYSCGICKTLKGSPVGLCIAGCFQSYHENKLN